MTTRALIMAVGAAAAAALAAAPPTAWSQPASRCPHAAADTTITTEDTDDGVVLEFRTETGDVDALRAHVRHMAAMHEDGGGRMRGLPPMPAATVEVEDLDDGARLVLRPEDPGDLDALREHARAHAARMASGDCPMM